jgi:hypothetical protein
MRARGAAVLLLAAVALAGCGEKPEPDLSKLAAVTGTVDLARSGPRAPATATTHRRTLAFDGSVKPVSARVQLTPPNGGPRASVRIGSDGHFRAEARKLRNGANRFVLRATSPGLRAWTVPVTITRK